MLNSKERAKWMQIKMIDGCYYFYLGLFVYALYLAVLMGEMK